MYDSGHLARMESGLLRLSQSVSLARWTFPCSANAGAILSATEGVPANETFDISATASPRSGNVTRDATSSTLKMEKQNGLRLPDGRGSVQI